MVRRSLLAVAALLALYCLLLAGLLFVGRHQSYPDESSGAQPTGGGLSAATSQLLGRAPETDFLLDYASAYALTHNDNAYDMGATLSERAGHAWAVSTANPHPPTLVTLVLPFTIFSYPNAIAAWALAMVFAVVATLWLAGIRALYAIPLGLAVSLAFPGAYGIGNPVPLIGLGIALAYRTRHNPWLAGVGLMLATAPKLAGALIFLPFLAARRVRTVAVGGLATGIVALIPMLWDRNVWSRYLDTGVEAGRLNAARGDNASLLNLADKWNIPKVAALVVIGAAALVMFRTTRDLLRPTIWFTVASLPIAWLYSLMTLMPLWVWSRHKPASRSLAIAAIGLTLASPPLGRWPVVVFPLIVLLTLASCCASALGGPDSDFEPRDFEWGWSTTIFRRIRPGRPTGDA